MQENKGNDNRGSEVRSEDEEGKRKEKYKWESQRKRIVMDEYERKIKRVETRGSELTEEKGGE